MFRIETYSLQVNDLILLTLVIQSYKQKWHVLVRISATRLHVRCRPLQIVFVLSSESLVSVQSCLLHQVNWSQTGFYWMALGGGKDAFHPDVL